MKQVSESLIAALLSNRVLKLDTKPLTAREFWSIFPDASYLEGVMEMDRDQLSSELNITDSEAERVRALLDTSRAFSFEVERLQETGVKLLTVFDEAFPQRLKATLAEQCPIVLLVAGSIEWLDQPSIGVVGSRGVGEEASEVAKDVAVAAVRADYGVVSGLAKGVDQIAMGAALNLGGRLCGIPTEGLHVIARRTDVRGAIHDGALALASPYGPDTPFSVGAAMGRNKLVYGLADATVVVTSDNGKGGTWGGATEALKKNYGRVMVWDGPGAGAGNAALIKKGASPFSEISSEMFSTAFASDPAGRQIKEVVEKQELFPEA